jgi:hypothetical protein
MNVVEDSIMTKKIFFTHLVLIVCFVALCTGRASSQTPQWSPCEKYDQGEDTSLAAHVSGLVLEVHQSHAIGNRGLWYHVGMLTSTSVSWGRSQSLGLSGGSWPNFAISKEGYVIFVRSSGQFKSGSELNYQVGKIDPYGTIDQSITWLSYGKWDAGFHSSIAINDNGTIVGVHESGTGGTGLYYRVGHLKNPNAGDYTIAWDSGEYGIKYDDGINPHIAINNLNQVVEVHQVGGESYLHYRRGNLSGGTVTFGGSPRYSNDGNEPTVALLDNGFVMELDSRNDGNTYARTGVLSSSDPVIVDWSPNLTKLSNEDSDRANYPALASNGAYAVGTWTSYSFDITGVLYSSVAKLP